MTVKMGEKLRKRLEEKRKLQEKADKERAEKLRKEKEKKAKQKAGKQAPKKAREQASKKEAPVKKTMPSKDLLELKEQFSEMQSKMEDMEVVIQEQINIIEKYKQIKEDIKQQYYPPIESCDALIISEKSKWKFGTGNYKGQEAHIKALIRYLDKFDPDNTQKRLKRITPKRKR